MDINKYIGLPFKANGRDSTGLDCWGLVRLFYKQEHNVELPSFITDYDISDDERIKDLFNQYKEGWLKLETPEPGCAILFNILGETTHIGIYIGDNKFLHVREGMDSVIESLDNQKWNRRVEGFYKYSENSGVVLNGIPHPLRTTRLTATVVPGTTLSELVQHLKSEYEVSEDFDAKYVVMVNGIPIDSSVWDTYKLKEHDTVAYRAILGKNNKFVRTALILTVAFVAYVIAGPAGGALASSFAASAGAGATAASFAGFVGTVAATAATVSIGMRLVDAISPIVAKQQADPGTSERQLLVDGGSNQIAKYSPIPVVLGKIKITPPLGAEPFSVFSGDETTAGADTGTENFLKMLLIWGYGPLSIDYNTLKIGDVLLSDYDSVTAAHLDRITEPTTAQLAAFDSIYGTDVQQLAGGAIPGPKITVNNVVKDALPPVTGTAGENNEWVPSTGFGEWREFAFTQPSERISVVLHFSQGLRRIQLQGDNSGSTAAAPVKIGLQYKIGNGSWQNWTTTTIGGTLDNNNFITGGAPKKDAFSWAITLNRGNRWNTNDLITLRVRRETGAEIEPNANWRYSHDCVVHSVTSYRNTKPTVDPINSKIAKSAFSIKATDQINGRVEGINAVVQTYCKDWYNNTWTDRVTNNPASLFRYVLTHPGTPNRILDSEISTKLDLAKLQYWHSYCVTKGFTYNSVIAGSNSVLDILREICAAGRASPIIVDGKWSVVIDEVQNNIIQHFTPHNSWGFQGTKSVIKYPDCLRVRFFDEDNNYQEDEVLVYKAGKDSTNAELFEEMQFAGVTKRSAIVDHARWHMAQVVLRPERYSLETDSEYLVCNRGDRVKVTHDVPMWGLGSGRLKTVVSTTSLVLEEPVYLDTTKSYTLRIRKQDGSSVTSTIVLPNTSGYYSSVTLSTALTGLTELDLYMFGELNQESQDLIVLGIQPETNGTATITFMDYGVTSTYNIFTDYLTYTELPSFVSNITKRPKNLIDSFVTKTPTNITFTSNETVMERKGPSDFVYRLLVSWTNAVDLPKTKNFVECQLDFASSTDESSIITKVVMAETYSALFEDVLAGVGYRIRLRYVGEDRRTGPWTSWTNHTIEGKTSNPSNVAGFSYEVVETGIKFSWTQCPDNDYATTVLKYGVSGVSWTTGTVLFNGTANSWTWDRPEAGTYNFLIKHRDTGNRESAEASTILYVTYGDPPILNSDITLTSAGELQGAGGGSVNLGSLNGYLNTSQTASGLEFIKKVNSLPTTYMGDRISYQSKLYHWLPNSPVQVDRFVSPDYSSNDAFGHGISVSRDGNVMVVGAIYWDGLTDEGAVYTYSYNGSSWTYLNTLLSSNRVASNYFGYKTALDATGLKMVVSSQLADPSGVSAAGFVETFTRASTSSAWQPVGSVLVDTTLVASDNFGNSLALSSDGNTLVVGVANKDYSDNYSGGTDRGLVRIYSWNSSTNSWTLTNTITLPEVETNLTSTKFGSGLALNSAGDLLTISSLYNFFGKIYTYKKVNNTWQIQPQVLEAPSVQSNQSFGGHLSMDSDGKILLVGAHNWSETFLYQGGFYIYDRSDSGGGTWVLRPGTWPFVASDPGASDAFSISCALNGAGTVVVAGATGWDVSKSGNQGSVYTYSIQSLYTATVNTTDLIGFITATQVGPESITTPAMAANSINGDRITANTLAASKIVANSITTAQIDTSLLQADNVLTRGLTVRDANGNIILSSGNNLDWTRLSNQPSGIYNSNISVDTNGAIQGIGTGAGTTVNNAFVENLVLLPGIRTTVSGNSTKRTDTNSAWNAHTYSKDGYIAGAYCSFTVNQTNGSLMVGLNSDPELNESYDSLDYAWYFENNNLKIYESGALVANLNEAYTTTDVFAVTYDGSYVRYLKNGEIKRTISSSTNVKLYFDCSIFSTGSGVSKINFGPMTSNRWEYVGGSNRPQDNATVGAPAGTLVGSTLAQTVESNASTALSTANAANTALATKLTKAGDTITGRISLAVADGIFAGTDLNNGVYFGNGGLVGKKAGNTTFAISTTGDAIYNGTVSAGNITAGTMQVGSSIESQGYPTTGWRLNSDGSAVFKGVVISRNNIIASGVHGIGTISGSQTSITLTALPNSFTAPYRYGNWYPPDPAWTTSYMAGPYLINTGVPILQWTSGDSPLIALVGFKPDSPGGLGVELNSASVPEANRLWGCEAKVLPYSTWVPSNATIWIEFYVNTKNIIRVFTNAGYQIQFNWFLYKVT